MHHMKRGSYRGQSSFSLSLRELCVHFILGPVKAHGIVILMHASSLCHFKILRKLFLIIKSHN